MVLYSGFAVQDLIGTFDYLLQQGASIGTATRYIDDLENICILIGDNPRLGRRRPELQPGLRSFPVRSHIVFYREVGDHVQIARILHGHRDVSEKLFVGSDSPTET